jgi:hypothetical protein
MQIPQFYEALAPASFALLGLWFVALQLRTEWLRKSSAQWRAYGVALNFALPGLMSLLALVDISTHTFWRVSFAVVGFGGALAMFLVIAYHGQARRDGTGPRHPTASELVALDPVGWLAYASIGIYVAVGALAVAGGANALRAVAVLLTIVLFLAFNVGWLLLYESRPPDPPPSAPADTGAAAADRRRGEREPALLS